jgi:hypothetical protein
VQFNYAVGAFESIAPSAPIVIVYETQGTQLHKESEEAKQQVTEQGLDRSHSNLLLFLYFMLTFCSCYSSD